MITYVITRSPSPPPKQPTTTPPTGRRRDLSPPAHTRLIRLRVAQYYTRIIVYVCCDSSPGPTERSRAEPTKPRRSRGVYIPRRTARGVSPPRRNNWFSVTFYGITSWWAIPQPDRLVPNRTIVLTRRYDERLYGV